jgi:arylsulfatase A-like enzyme
MMAASLFAVFLAARLAILWGRPLPLSPWAPLAFLWQDVAIVLLFLLFERIVRRAWPVRVVYAVLVVMAAANVAVGRVLSSALTAPLLRAARGALSDSLFYHATPSNLVLTGWILVVGAGAPWVLGRLLRVQQSGVAGHPAGARTLASSANLLRVQQDGRRAALVAACCLVLVGPAAAARVDTRGLERNPVFSLVRTSVPRVRAEASAADWRASPVKRAPAGGKDLGHLQGIAAGSNVLLVVLESTAARYLKPYGAAEDPMPNFTALAARSIVFENAYAVYPESIKGLVAMLASRYPGFDVAAERHAPMMRPSLATRLGAEGYETALFHSGRLFYLGMDAIVGGSGFARVEDAGDIGGNHDSSFGVDEASAVTSVLRWIDGVPRGRRFFAAYLPIAGHHPYSYSIAGPFPEEHEIDRYRNALYEGDVALGKLLEGLRARGLEESTVVIVIGDHGEAFGQHTGNYGHNLALHDENVRVPFIVFVSGGGGGSRVAKTASLIDVAPTVLDLLGLQPPREFQGESLLAPHARMALFFTDYSLGLLGLRDDCMKYIHELESNRSKLFDLCLDPEERVDLAASHRHRVARYRQHLRGWSAAEVARIMR